MKALIIYDSFFGNTEKIALAVGKAIGNQKDVRVSRVADVSLDQLEDLNVLITGSPTRAFSPTPAMKTFLKSIPQKSLCGVKVAAFDTRIAMTEKVPGILRFFANLFGYADKPMLEILKKKGGEASILSEGFFVVDSEGPLADGELDRAAAWAAGD